MVELYPFDASRKEGFEAEVIELGIRRVGDDEKPVGYIKFADEGADITFFLTDPDGKPLINEKAEPGKPNIKTSSDIGVFAMVARHFGFKTDISIEDLRFETVPPLAGHITTWGEKKKKKIIKSDGSDEESSYVNFRLCGIDGKMIDDKMMNNYNIIKPTGLVASPSSPQNPAAEAKIEPQGAKPQGLDSKALERWEIVLNQILVNPMSMGDIHRAVMKAFPTEVEALAKTRTEALKELQIKKKIQQDADLKYSLV